ncbi:Rho termination factor N-terminal domain-containing protein [Globicatella sanguinis]|uniref:Rho termination factor N-terminal domain-containing protein n=1 Tax=Globicatella sanguinis TaxID=13076 RepID=UPI0008241D3F|nr:Rho termination factor N-terminal domain-containing protein [Globicatella sanguinis]
MKFINTKNGAIIDVVVPVKGGDWVPFEEPKAPVEEVEPVVEEPLEEEPEAETFDLTAMTVEELKEYAKDNEITLPSKATKAQIIELIAEAFNG